MVRIRIILSSHCNLYKLYTLMKQVKLFFAKTNFDMLTSERSPSHFGSLDMPFVDDKNSFQSGVCVR